jgi:hypothetical protein
VGFNEDTDTRVRSSVIPSSRSDSCGDGGAAHKQHRCLKPSAKENFDLLFAPRVAPVRSAAWNLIVLSGSNIRMLSNRENTLGVCWSALVHTYYFRPGYRWGTVCSTSLIVMLSGRMYSPVDLHAGLFEFDFMHVPPVAQAERVLYAPRKEAEKHTTEPDGSRICAGLQTLFHSWTLNSTTRCAGVIAVTFL